MPTTKPGVPEKAAFKKAGASVTSSADNTIRKEVSVKVGQSVIVFFIGGAGDKESYYGTGPFGNIEEVREYCKPVFENQFAKNLYLTEYLGYNEVCGEQDIQEYVIKKIPNKSTPIYIIGHSLGGWNGAHLSGILNTRGYHMEMLITLDPVGEGFGVHNISDLHPRRPQPAARFWINIRADKKWRDMDGSDAIAWMGEQWTVKEGPHLNYVAPIHHANALKMFIVPLKDRKSAWHHFYGSIKKKVSP